MATEMLHVQSAAVSGNGIVESVAEAEEGWEVRFLAEPRRSPQPLWFNLECDLSEPAQIRFVWANADACLGLGSPNSLEQVRPVVCLDGGHWRRVETVAVTPRDLGGHTLTFSTPEPCETASAAFCYPYGPAELRETLALLDTVWQEQTIGLTGGSRALTRLRAGARTPEGLAAYILARQHAGETPASWLLDGLLRAVGEDDEMRRVEWWVVPFVDLDGVLAGDYGKDAFPVDFNRSWSAMPMRPEVAAVQADVERFAARFEQRLLVDLHAPGGAEKGFYQFLPREGRPRAQREAALSFTSRLADQFPGMLPHQLGRATTYPSRWNTDRTAANWAWDELEQTLGVSAETSYQGIEEGYWDTEGYRDIGGRLARAVAGWLLSRPPSG